MLDKTQIKSQLRTSIFGQYLFIYPELHSTNNYLKKVAAEGAPEGTVVLTEFQLNGKGRLGRVWKASAGQNILMSILLRPKLSIDNVQCITLATASIILQSLERCLKNNKIKIPQFGVKWPNDILIGMKKLAGILIESSLQDKWIEYLVVGIGININQKIGDLDPELKDKATSLFAETGIEFNRENLIASIINTYEKEYIHLESTGYHGVTKKWKSRCAQIGKRICVQTPVSVEYGLFKDVNEAGFLLYETDDGQLKELVAGTIDLEGNSACN